jgi:DNA-directed RNA polymerase specialized sigma24 family protein
VIELPNEQRQRYLAAGRRGARRASRDPEVIGDAANFALEQLLRHWDSVGDDDRVRSAWIATVALRRARRVGAKLHRELPMGRAGSRPPRTVDAGADVDVGRLITETHGAASLGSAAAARVDVEARFAQLSGEARQLLVAKYVLGLTSRQIAADRSRGETEGTINNKLTAAKREARALFADLVG